MTTQTLPARRDEQNTAVATPVDRDASPIAILERVITTGDLARLTPQERVALYARTCESLGLNPLTRPFEYISLNGKLVLYVRKDATDQLRATRRVSVDDVRREKDDELGLLTVYAGGHTPDGRRDESTGVVSIKGLSGEALANAAMKAETKAKRRLTLSLVGLGFLDESEVEGADRIDVDPETGEVRQQQKPASLLDAVQAQRERLQPTPASTSSAATAAPPASGASDGAPVAAEQPTQPEAATATEVCGDEDASPMALGLCAKPPHRTGPHGNENGTWPGRRG